MNITAKKCPCVYIHNMRMRILYSHKTSMQNVKKLDILSDLNKKLPCPRIKLFVDKFGHYKY